MTAPGGAHGVSGPKRRRVYLDGSGKLAIDQGRNRLLMVAVLFALCFTIIAARLVSLGLFAPAGEARLARAAPTRFVVERADITDRNGEILATNLVVASLYADPRRVLDAAEAAAGLAAVLPGLDRDVLAAKLESPRSFQWIRRNLTPRQQWQVNRLGIPGLAFIREQRRVYPHGPLAGHAVGYVDIDNKGLAGIEKRFNGRLGDRRQPGPLALSLDLRVQHIVRQELAAGIEKFSAKGAAGIVMDVATGELLALVSLPDFDPNKPGVGTNPAMFNRVTLGVYELGSIFKTFTTAMALEKGVVDLDGGYDATEPIRVARYTIHDSHAKKRWLSVPEIFMYSSNVGAAKMALDVGTDEQRSFLAELGLLTPAVLELPEIGAPLVPRPWRDINTMTISYGHGIAVSPLQVATATAAVVNGGILRAATLIRREPAKEGAAPAGRRVISEHTSSIMRRLLRLVVEKGTGKQARAEGYLVGGKTGTAEKSGLGGYREEALVSSFVGVFPATQPRFLVFAMFDEPQGIKATFGYATGGWNAAPAVGHIVSRISPVLGIRPVDEQSPEYRAAALVLTGG